MKRSIPAIVAVAVVLFLSLTLAVAGDVQITIKWPDKLPQPDVQKVSSEDGAISVTTDMAGKRVILANVPTSWAVNVVSARVSTPCIRVAHAGMRSDEVLLKAYMDREFLTDASLVAPGEVAELPTANRIVIEVKKQS